MIQCYNTQAEREKLLEERMKRLKEKVIARQCINFQRFYCKNKQCKNTECPLNEDIPDNLEGLKNARRFKYV